MKIEQFMSGATAAYALVTVALMASSAIAGAATFQSLGYLPGGTNSSASGVSADGSVVVGKASSVIGTQAFRWTAATGMAALGDLPGATVNSSAAAVSADGSVVVGTSASALGNEAFRWTADGGMVGLGAYSEANGVSGDGSAVVGYSAASESGFSWTAGGGMVGCCNFYGQGGVASAISADGTVIVGYSLYSYEGPWGDWLTASAACAEPFGVLCSGYASDVSADGSVIVGGDGGQAFRWTPTEMRGLGKLSGDNASGAGPVSPDGSVIVGFSGIIGVSSRGFVWAENLGMLPLDLVLASVLPPGWAGAGVSDVTVNNGTATLVGAASNPEGKVEAFIATVALSEYEDVDQDGVPNPNDNCPYTWNPDQTDHDGNGVGDVCDRRTITQWRSIRSHSGLGELGLALDARGTGNGPSGPTAESRGTAALGMGVRIIDIEFSAPVSVINPAAITVSYWDNSSRKIGGPLTIIPVVSMVNVKTIRLSFNNTPPDQAYYCITVGPTTIAELLEGDTDCMIRSLVGDVNGDGHVNSADVRAIQCFIGQPAQRYPQFDLNLDGVINAADASYAKSRNGKKALCP